MHNISFRKAVPADIPLIRSLAESIWWQHYPSIISPEQITYMLGRMYSADSIASQMEQGQGYTLIFADGQPAGYYSVGAKGPGHFFLHKFYIDTSLHRQGIGVAAFHHLVESDCRGYEEISLQVNRQNIKAINFYFKQGFVITEAKDFDIGGGYSMDDFVMRKCA
jgi:ribosomal protein S18 acetylase RimI-like enzyme